MKKLVCMALVMAMSLSLLNGCQKSSESKEETATEVANPIHECSKEELSEKTGVSLEAPDGAEDAKYSYIDGNEKVAQVEFSLDDKNYCYRAKLTSEIFDMSAEDENASLEDVKESVEDMMKAGEELSGYYEKWNQAGSAEVSYCSAIFEIKNKGVGFISWFDVVPGILYSLSTEDGTSSEELVRAAETVFVPAQGDAE